MTIPPRWRSVAFNVAVIAYAIAAVAVVFAVWWVAPDVDPRP